MNFENSKYYKKLTPYKLTLSFGSYFITDKFIIAEVNEGVHFGWKEAELVIQNITELFGKDVRLVFISNRINHYSLDPRNWIKLEEKYDIIIASAIVIYNASTYMNASIEKQFSKNSIKRASSLDEAIEWASNLKEFN